MITGFKMTTSRGRVRHFGPIRVVQQHHCKTRGPDDPCRWIRVSSNQRAPITGMFIDVNNYLGDDNTASAIGFTQDKPSAQDTHNPEPLGPMFLEIPAATAALPYMPYETKRGLRASALLSSASLSDIVQLQVRKKHGRCVGLHLLYSDSTVETLGQWDPIDKTSASTNMTQPMGF